jgi:hypothetical protein
MRVSKTLGSVVAAAIAVAVITLSSSSRAGDESLLTVTCSAGAVTVTAAAPWHINDKAPWKFDKGEKVSLDEHAAKFKGASCAGTVKAFICSGDQCKGPIAVPVK